MTSFEDFFKTEWQRLLEETRVPRSAMAQPSTGEVSWDRRAAWLLFKVLQPEEVSAMVLEEMALAEPELTEDGY